MFPRTHTLGVVCLALSFSFFGVTNHFHAFGQNADAPPIATVDLRFEKVIELLPEPPKEAQLQIDTIRETGLQTIRIALLPDKKRIVVPVIKISGDMNALNATLADPTSPLRIIATPVGDAGLYQLPTSEKDPLQLQLHKSPDALVFAPVGLAEAARVQALAAAPMAFKPEHAIVLDGRFPEKLNLDWFKPLFMQNAGAFGEDPEAEGADFAIGMMTGLLGGILQPFERTERVTGGVFILPSGHRVLDWNHTFRDPKSAEHATAVFNRSEEAKVKKLGRGIQKTLEEAFRSKAIQDGNTSKARIVWNKGDDENMMEGFSRHVMRSFMGGGGMQPASEPVPTTEPVPVIDLSIPYDAGQVASELPKALPNYIWYLRDSTMELDPVREPNANLVSAGFTALSAKSADGKELLLPPKGDLPAERRIALVPSMFTHLNFEYDREQKERPSTGRGRIVLKVPEQRHVIKIPAGTEEWTSFKAGEHELTVEQLVNDVAMLSLDGGTWGPIQALDKEGRALSTVGRSWGKENQALKYKGTVAELHVVVLSEQTREVPVEFDVTFNNETWDGRRERYAKQRDLPETHTPLLASDFDNLEVTWTPGKEQGGTLDVPFAKPGTAAKTRFTIQGFGPEGPVKFSSYGRDGTKATLYSGVDKCGLLYGSATVSGPIESTVIEVTKTADGEAVPFEVHGQTGTVTFNTNRVVVSKSPSGMQASIQLYKNAQGRPLHYDQYGIRACYGIPVSVKIIASKEPISRTLPFSFELGPYDKAALADFKLGKFIKPSPDPVPTTDPVAVVQLDQPYQADEFSAAMPTVVPRYLWWSGRHRSGATPSTSATLDPIQYPNISLATAKFTATSVLATNGTEILREDARYRERTLTLSKRNDLNFTYQPKQGAADRGKGQLTLTIPEARELVRIPANTESGKTFATDAGTITVDLIKNDVVALSLNAGKFGTIQALDQEGRALKFDPKGRLSKFGFPLHDSNAGKKELRFQGTIHELHVVLLSEATRSVKVDVDLRFEPEPDNTRERYIYPDNLPKAFTGTEAADFENLTVEYIPRNRTTSYHYLKVPFAKTLPDADVDFTLFGFGPKGPLNFINARGVPETGNLSNMYGGNFEACSVIFGEAILKGRTGTELITVAKTTDGAEVPFEVNGQRGGITFNGNDAKITRRPKGARCAIFTYDNAEGQPLIRHVKGYCIGVPSSVKVKVATGIEIHRIPFEFDLGRDYDKAAYAAYKKEKQAAPGGGVNRIQPSAEPVPTTKIAPRLDLTRDYEPETLAKQLSQDIPKHLWFEGTRSGSGSFLLGHMPELESMAKHIKATFTPISAVTSNGVDVLKKPLDEPRPIQLSGNARLTIPFDRSQGTPSNARGRLTLAMPRFAEYITIPASTKPDQTLLLGFAELLIQSIDNDVAQLTIKDGQFAEVQALDKEGNALTRVNRDGDPRDGFSATTYRRYSGTIHELQLRVIPSDIQEIPFEFDLAFKKATEDEAMAAGREKYRTWRPERFPNVDASVLEQLEVTLNPANKERGIYEPYLDTPIPTPAPQHRTNYKMYGFGTNGVVKLRKVYSDGTRAKLNREAKTCGVLFGEATVSGPTDVRYIELDKVADGAPVAFTVNDADGTPQDCELVFDKNSVNFTKRPRNAEGARIDILELKNAQGHALEFLSTKVWGIPTKAVLYTSSGTATRTIPFEFERGDYDKAGLAAYKEQLQMMDALRKLAEGASSNYSATNTLAGLYYFHGRDDKPLKSIPEEIAHADPYGAELFGYEVKPYLGYYFVTCTTWEKTGKPVHTSTREYDMKWDGGERKLTRARLGKFNAVPVDSSKPTLFFDGYAVHAKNLGEQPAGTHYRLVPDMRAEEHGWKFLGRTK